MRTHTDHDPLFYLVYERVPVVEGSLEPHLWGYRPCITLEHLTRYMQQQKTKYPLLKEFLKEVGASVCGCPSVCLSVSLSICLASVHQSVRLSICPASVDHLSVCPYVRHQSIICPSVHMSGISRSSVRLSICPASVDHLSVCPYVRHQSVRLSICFSGSLLMSACPSNVCKSLSLLCLSIRRPYCGLLSTCQT